MTRRNANCLGVVVAVGALVGLLVGDLRAENDVDPPLRTRAGIVAADHPLASRVGAEVLARGGNAVDAAAATALALGVVNPVSSGIGGGGFALVYIASEKRTYVFDFRETAPAALSPASFERDGELDVALARSGGLAVGVPGEVAGLELLVKRFGRRSWRRAVAPAQQLASEGFTVGDFLARAFGGGLINGGEGLSAGQQLVRPELASTLATIARRGRDGFYTGPVARDIIAAITGAGGVMSAEDLAGYGVVERQPLVGTLGRYRIVTMPLPSSGGIVLLEALGILAALGEPDQDRPLAHLASLGSGSAPALHLIAEALKHAFADRARFLGDTEAATAAGGELLSPARLRGLAARIATDKVAAHASYGDAALGSGGLAPPARGGGTSHLCVVDRDGNAVALTTTVNGYFGAKLVAPDSGVVLNNEIDDFSLRAGVANMFGLVQSDFNLVAAGKRPLSSMTPTLVFAGDRVVACAGGSGGPRIISNTLQVLIDVLVFAMDARAAVRAPRIHHQWIPDRLRIESEAGEAVMRALRQRGHTIAPYARWSSPTAVQLVVVRPDGTREAASDPRKGGAPAAEPDRP